MPKLKTNTLTEGQIEAIETRALSTAAAQMLLDNAAGDVAELLTSIDAMIRTIGETTSLCPGCIVGSLAEHIGHAPSADEDDVDAELDSVVDELDAASAPKQIH